MKYLNILLVSFIALAACQEAYDAPDVFVSDGIMRFDLQAPGVKTKADGQFVADEKIGLYVTDYLEENKPMPLQISGNRANNVGLIFDGDMWAPEETLYWGECKSDVYAYYPYFEVISDVNALPFEVAVDQTGDGYESSDFLWAKAEGVAQADGEVSLAMKHVMSKLVVRIVAGESYVGSLPEDATVQIHNTVTGSLVNLESGSVEKAPASTSHSIDMKNLGVKTVEDGKAVVYEAIVVPQMITSIVPFLEINSKSVSYMIEDAFTFRPGVVYVYTVTLNTSTTSIKFDLGCEVEDWNSGSDGEEGDSGEGDGDDEEDIVYTDLSENGTANCYLVSEAGHYKFKAAIGNTNATVGIVKNVKVLWETFGTDVIPEEGDCIASAFYKDGYVYFSTPETFVEGNAGVAALGVKGTVLWSWHIWLSDEGWTEQAYYNDAGIMMDRNLGATSATPGNPGTIGLLYSWGRKDPFIGLASVTSGVNAGSTGVWTEDSGRYSADQLQLMGEINPMTDYTYHYNMPEDAWTQDKTINDPCPLGWRIPDGGEENIWNKASGKSSSFYRSWDYANSGMQLSGVLGPDENIWYPWVYSSRTATYHSLTKGYGLYLYYYSQWISIGGTPAPDTVYPNYAIGYMAPVRCQKED